MKMKNFIEKYNNLDEETKRMMPLFYMYNEIRTALKNNFMDLRIGIYEEGVIMNVTMKCWEKLTLDPSEVVYRLLSMLECRDITVDDFKDLDIDGLKELLYDNYDKENEQKNNENIELDDTNKDDGINEDNLEVIEEFDFERIKCVFCRDIAKNRYVVLAEDGDERDAITFNSIKAPLSPLLRHYIRENDLYYGKINK